jgi:hypothetical protein
MAISLTLFKPPRWWEEKERFVYDNKTHRRMDFSSFDELEKLLYGLSRQPKKGKKDAELISPAVYESGTTRSNKNVTAWAGWCAVDVDDIEVNGDLNALVSKLAGDWRFVCYSTASSRIDKPKFRLVFELNRHLQQTEIKHFWFALQSHLDDRGDKQCKDLSRMYYIPATYAEAYNFIFSGNSNHIDVDNLLSRYPYVEKTHSKNFMDRLPDELQKKIVQYRMDSMSNQGYSWTSYEDCPFVNRNLVRDYKAIAYTDNSGRYAMIYKIMTSIAINAIKKEYPITTFELVDLIRQLDRDTSNRYENRALDIEADRAIEYAYRNS